jgi:hypothetical protein
MSIILGLNIILTLNTDFFFSCKAVSTTHEMSWQFFLYMEGNVFINFCSILASHTIWTVCYIMW